MEKGKALKKDLDSAREAQIGEGGGEFFPRPDKGLDLAKLRTVEYIFLSAIMRQIKFLSRQIYFKSAEKYNLRLPVILYIGVILSKIRNFIFLLIHFE